MFKYIVFIYVKVDYLLTQNVINKVLSYSPSAINFLLKESEAIVEEARYISSMVSHEYDKKMLNTSMDDYKHALDNLKQRIVKNWSEGNLEVASIIGNELWQFQMNVWKTIQSDETFLILLKLRASERISQNSTPDTKLELHEQKTIEIREEPNQIINEAHADDDIHQGFNEDVEEIKTNTEDEIDDNKTQLTVDELKRLVEEIRGVMSKGKTLVGKEVLDLDFSHSWTTKLIRKIAENYLLPKSIVRINVYSLDEDNQPLQNMLKSSIKHNIKGLALNLEALETVSEFKLNLSNYLESILSVLPLITDHIDLNYFNITGMDLEDTLKNSKHIINEISFAGSDIILNYEPNFGTEEFKLENLNLDECTISSLHGDQLGIKHLMNAISKSGLSESLKKIDRWKCNIPSETFQEILKENKISKIWIESD